MHSLWALSTGANKLFLDACHWNIQRIVQSTFRTRDFSIREKPEVSSLNSIYQITCSSLTAVNLSGILIAGGLDREGKHRESKESEKGQEERKVPREDGGGVRIKGSDRLQGLMNWQGGFCPSTPSLRLRCTKCAARLD